MGESGGSKFNSPSVDGADINDRDGDVIKEEVSGEDEKENYFQFENNVP
jgi:hypothetical protein